MSNLGEIIVQFSVVIGVLGSAILFAYKTLRGGARDYDKGTIESLKSSVSALEIERDLLKERVSEQDRQLLAMRSEIASLRELVTQRAEVEKLHEDLLKFMPLIPAVSQFQEEHERMLYMLTAIVEHMAIKPNHKFIKRKPRNEVEPSSKKE